MERSEGKEVFAGGELEGKCEGRGGEGRGEGRKVLVDNAGRRDTRTWG